MKTDVNFSKRTSSALILRTVLIIAIPLVLLTSVAVAAVVNNIDACVNNKTGSVRVLNFTGGTCAKTETALSWNILGPKGEKGDPGVPGINGISGWEKVEGDLVQSIDRVVIATAECPVGKKVLGGGYAVGANEGTVQTLANAPISDATWHVKIIGNVSFSAQAFALCSSVLP